MTDITDRDKIAMTAGIAAGFIVAVDSIAKALVLVALVMALLGLSAPPWSVAVSAMGLWLVGRTVRLGIDHMDDEDALEGWE